MVSRDKKKSHPRGDPTSGRRLCVAAGRIGTVLANAPSSISPAACPMTCLRRLHGVPVECGCGGGDGTGGVAAAAAHSAAGAAEYNVVVKADGGDLGGLALDPDTGRPRWLAAVDSARL